MKNNRVIKGEKSYHVAHLRTKKGTELHTASNDNEAHAETEVVKRTIRKYGIKYLTNICHKEGGFVLEVVRFSTGPKDPYRLMSSKPCQHCQNYIEKCPGICLVIHS